MRSGFVKKMLCVFAAAALAFSLAACGNNDDTENSTAPSAQEDLIADETADVIDSETDSQADVSENNSESDTQAENSEKTTESAGVSMPESKADIIAAYNKAVAKSGLSRTAMSQNVTKGTASVVNYDIMASKNEAVRNKVNVSNTAKTASDLKALSASNVANAVRNGNTVTISLNSVSSSSVSNGVGGYVGVVDDTRRNQVIDIITADIGVTGVELASGTYSIQNGVIKATFNDDFTKITKVTFTATEKYDGKIKYLFMSVDVSFALNLSSTYSA